MNEPTENVAKIGPSKVTLFPKRDGVNFSAKSVPEQFQTDIIGVDRLQEEIIMPQDTYSKTEIDLKFEKVDMKFDMLMQRMDDGFEKQRLSTEKMLSDLKLSLVTEQQKNKREFTYWFVGLLVSSILGILAIIVTVLTAK